MYTVEKVQVSIENINNSSEVRLDRRNHQY